MENNCNCKVMQTDDHSHVTQTSPIQLKRKELADANAMMEPELRAQEIATRHIRRGTDARPLGGA